METLKIKQEPGLKTKTAPASTAANATQSASPTAAIKTERLSSFRVPRDLTLGGITNGRTPKLAPNKKVYTPNLNAVRNKDTNVKTASTGSKQRVRPERNKDAKSQGRKGNLIQTAGIFSEGLAQRTLQRSKYDKFSTGSSKDPGEAMRRPVLRSEIKVDPEEERKRMRDLFGHDLDDDETMSEETKKYEQGMDMPVKLDNVDYKLKTSALKTEIKDELTPKPEAADLLEAIKADATQNNFFLLQLPDALPAKTDTAESTSSNRKAVDPQSADPTAAVNSNGDQQPEPARCTVRELEEGYIGKVLRYRSGKVKFLLGTTMFDLTMGMDSGFLQELVSISTNPEERSGNIINLASVKAKLNASPDWEYLFQKTG
ncbi:DNA-directed RNA polymerase III subunit RPC4-like [Uranotaenia lowii]|uniref:DNA-directed RNA polymerase III subunit RPC4-like n=1 Tax=Uranotaenia lowii TaxID=190385 RepID=UPI002479D244|nr:DNA-directed RNA polymerase III subunit RPC4-like [Uranotaenia lowii]